MAIAKREEILMNSTISGCGNLNIPNVSWLGHEEVRARLRRATMGRGLITDAAKCLADFCLPHFEWEEKTVFPILRLLPDLKRGNVRPEMMDVMPLIADFNASQDVLCEQHQAILSAIQNLLRAAHREENREFVEFANIITIHEQIEDDVVYPAVLLIGQYLREKLAIRGIRRFERASSGEMVTNLPGYHP